MLRRYFWLVCVVFAAVCVLVTSRNVRNADSNGDDAILTQANAVSTQAGAESTNYVEDLSQTGSPLVLVVAIDGLRFDYVTKEHMPNLVSLAKEGAWARKGMIPIFPTETTPNFVSLSTGLYAESHGVDSNVMYNDTTGEAIYDYWGFSGDAMIEPSRDAHWYHGTPFWQLNNDAGRGRKTGSMYWPTGNVRYNGREPGERVEILRRSRPDEGLQLWSEDIDRLIGWFEDKDPINLGMLYFLQPDETEHLMNISSMEILQVIRDVDAAIGYLMEKIQQSDTLRDRINVVVVSDHGHANVDMSKNVLEMTDYLGDELSSKIRFTFASLHPLPISGNGTVDWHAVYKGLSKKKHLKEKKEKKKSHFKVYRRKDIPEHYHIKRAPYLGPITVLSEPGYYLNFRPNHDQARFHTSVRGMHGFSNKFKEMWATFVAFGPDIRKGVTVEPFENVNVYPLICRLLGVAPAANNGSLESLGKILVKREAQTQPDPDGLNGSEIRGPVEKTEGTQVSSENDETKQPQAEQTDTGQVENHQDTENTAKDGRGRSSNVGTTGVDNGSNDGKEHYPGQPGDDNKTVANTDPGEDGDHIGSKEDGKKSPEGDNKSASHLKADPKAIHNSLDDSGGDDTQPGGDGRSRGTGDATAGNDGQGDEGKNERNEMESEEKSGTAGMSGGKTETDDKSEERSGSIGKGDEKTGDTGKNTDKVDVNQEGKAKQSSAQEKNPKNGGDGNNVGQAKTGEKDTKKGEEKVPDNQAKIGDEDASDGYDGENSDYNQSGSHAKEETDETGGRTGQGGEPQSNEGNGGSMKNSQDSNSKQQPDQSKKDKSGTDKGTQTSEFISGKSDKRPAGEMEVDEPKPIIVVEQKTSHPYWLTRSRAIVIFLSILLPSAAVLGYAYMSARSKRRRRVNRATMQMMPLIEAVDDDSDSL